MFIASFFNCGTENVCSQEDKLPYCFNSVYKVYCFLVFSSDCRVVQKVVDQ